MTDKDQDKGQPVQQYRCVSVCQHQSCQRNGSADVLEAFRKNQIPNVTVNPSDCMGQCSSGPTVVVYPDKIWYCRVKPSDVPMIVEQHFQRGEPIQRLLHPRIHPRFY